MADAIATLNAESQIEDGTLVAFANADVFFDESVANLIDFDMTNVVVALSRYDVRADGAVVFNRFIASLAQVE